MVWIADTNYRVDLDNDTARYLAENDGLDALVASDQASQRALRPLSDTSLTSSLMKLKNAMDSGAAFVGYEEGPILFRPTYRYDVGTDIYDTSEKMRIPAWTGRYSKQRKWFMTLTFLCFRPYTLSWESVGSECLLACRVEGIRSPPGLCGVSYSRTLYSSCDNVPM